MIKNQKVEDISEFIRQHGLDPAPITEPTSVRRGDERLVTESYGWGVYHVATRDHRAGVAYERVAWVGGPEYAAVPVWARKLALASDVTRNAQGSYPSPDTGPTQRAKQRLAKRRRWQQAAPLPKPESVALANRCVELISARCRRRLARSQGSSMDGDLFVRDHYKSSKYLSLFVRQGERITKLAQIWPLVRRNAFHVQLQGLTQDALRQMIPPQYEVVTWSDRKPRVVVKGVDEVGISYVARAVAKRMEAEGAL